MNRDTAVAKCRSALAAWELQMTDQYDVMPTDGGFQIRTAYEGTLDFTSFLDDNGLLMAAGDAEVRLTQLDNGWLVLQVAASE
jgi:hypothetical protein